MKNAFTYMFKDNMLVKKTLLLFTLVLLQTSFPFISSWLSKYAGTSENLPAALGMLLLGLIVSLLGLICSIIFCGYFVTCVKSIAAQKDNIVLPFINIKNNLILGLKYMVAYGLFMLIVIGMFLFPLVLTAIPASRVLGIVLLVLTALFVIALLALFSIGFMGVFAHTEKLTSFIQFNKVFKLICDNKKQYFIALLFGALYSILIPIITFAIPYGIRLIVYFLLIPYTAFVMAYFPAKAIPKEQFESIKW